MKTVLFSIFATLILLSSNAQTLEKLRCEFEETPFGLEIIKPRLSWQIKSTTRGTKQTAYQVLVADNEADLKKDNGNIWNSGMVKSENSLGVVYGGKVESRKRYFWKVKIWNEKNKPTNYSEPTWWEMALLQKSDWSAHWIGKNSSEGKSVELQKEFNLAKRATRARIYVTGLGAYHLTFNGKKVSQDILTPGITKYSKTIPYQIYEISNDDLSIGTNFITATLGNAWQNEKVPCRFLFQMELDFYDGSRQTIISDGSWKTRLSPIISNTINGGEVYNAQLEYGKDWENSAIMDDLESKLELKPQISPQMQVSREIKSIKISEPKKSRFVFDFGQNIVGFVHLKVEGKATKEIEMKFAEVLTDKGLVETKNLSQIDKYILKGYGVEQWESKFTLHSFRYVEIEGLPKKPDENNLVAKVISENAPFVENLANSEAFLSKIYAKKTIVEPNLNEAKLVIAPILASESKNFDSNYGQITSQSNLQGNKFSLKLSIPANTSVQIQLPLQSGKTINNIKEGSKPFIVKKKPVKIEGITFIKTEKDKAIFEVFSGNYEFVVE